MSKTKAKGAKGTKGTKGTKRGRDEAVLKCRLCDQLGHTTKDEGKCLCIFCGQPGSPPNLDGHATKHCEAVKQIVMEMFGLDETDRVIDARIYAVIYAVALTPNWTANSIAPSGLRREVADLLRDSPANWTAGSVAPSGLRRKVVDLLRASPTVAPETVSQVEKLLETPRSTWQEVVSQVVKFLETPRSTWQEVVILARDQVQHRPLEEAQEEEPAQLVVGAKIAKAVEEPNGSFGIQWLRCVGELFSPEAKHILEQVLKDGERARDSDGRAIIPIRKTEEDPATGKVCSWPLDPAKAPREAFTAQNQDVFQREMAKRELAEQAKRQRV